MPLITVYGVGQQVSDFSPLEECKSLTLLKLKGSKATAAQVAALQQALPKCKIEWDEPASAAGAVNQNLKTGPALEFDGVDDVVEVPSIGENLKAPLTIETWVTPANMDAGQSNLIVIGADDGPRFKLKRFRNEWHALAGNQSQRWALSALVPGQRVHLAGVFSERNQVTLFVDGVASAPVDVATLTTTERISGMLRIGLAMQSGARTPFAGIVDQVRISNTARYTTNFKPPTEFATDVATLALYRFDEGTGNTLHDSSGKNHHGKITGAKWVSIPRKVASVPGDNTTAPKKLAYLDPAFQQWVTQTQNLPADKQVDAVSKKLRELNPGFDGKLLGGMRPSSPRRLPALRRAS
jgi:hypothetical protein